MRAAAQKGRSPCDKKSRPRAVASARIGSAGRAVAPRLELLPRDDDPILDLAQRNLLLAGRVHDFHHADDLRFVIHGPFRERGYDRGMCLVEATLVVMTTVGADRLGVELRAATGTVLLLVRHRVFAWAGAAGGGRGGSLDRGTCDGLAVTRALKSRQTRHNRAVRLGEKTPPFLRLQSSLRRAHTISSSPGCWFAAALRLPVVDRLRVRTGPPPRGGT